MLRRVVREFKFELTKRTRGFNVPNSPSFDPRSIDMFQDELGKAKCYLEYGSGGSTVLASTLGIPGVTVESDRYYASSVRNKIRANHSNKREIIYINIGITGMWGNPRFSRPTPTRTRKWMRYVDAPFQDGRPSHYDLVLVDGRFRLACALKVISHSVFTEKLVTLLIDDYEGRPRYHGVEQFAGRPAMHGRMARFQIRPDTLHANPSGSDIDRAIMDFS